MLQSVKCFPCKHENLSLIPRIHAGERQDVVAGADNSSTRKEQEGLTACHPAYYRSSSCGETLTQKTR